MGKALTPDVAAAETHIMGKPDS